MRWINLCQMADTQGTAMPASFISTIKINILPSRPTPRLKFLYLLITEKFRDTYAKLYAT